MQIDDIIAGGPYEGSESDMSYHAPLADILEEIRGGYLEEPLGELSDEDEQELTEEIIKWAESGEGAQFFEGRPVQGITDDRFTHHSVVTDVEILELTNALIEGEAGNEGFPLQASFDATVRETDEGFKRRAEAERRARANAPSV